MNLRLSVLAPPAAPPCSPTSSIAPAQKDNYSAKSAEKLGKALAGRSPGPTRSAASATCAARMQVVDDQTILFREGGTVLCSEAARRMLWPWEDGNYTLVTRISGTSRLCSGQIGELVDPHDRLQLRLLRVRRVRAVSKDG